MAYSRLFLIYWTLLETVIVFDITKQVKFIANERVVQNNQRERWTNKLDHLEK